MYEVVRSGGKQVRVSPGDAVRVEKLPGDVGDAIELDEVLLVGGEGDTRVGQPLVDGGEGLVHMGDAASGDLAEMLGDQSGGGERESLLLLVGANPVGL